MLAHRSAARVVVTSHRRSPHHRGAALECRASFFGKLFGGGGDSKMGAAASTPSAAGASGRISRSGFDLTPLTPEQRAAEAARLTPLQRSVTLDHGTERAFTGATVDGTKWDAKQKGVYVSALGGLPLFSAAQKFDSGTGWPSFWAPVDPEHVELRVDRSVPFMPRTEVLCAKSGAHLGHVFDDGPRPTGKRFCINAAALRFVPQGEPLPLPPKAEE
jgi:methionine-R-sulfoxide reductase